MAKRTALEADEARLKQKVTQRRPKPGNPEADPALRNLRKRLKRLQRRRRALAIRKRHAQGKVPEGVAKAEGQPAS
jgi:hypothetical protein